MGIMEKKVETTIVYWGNIGIMEKKMETTRVPTIINDNDNSHDSKNLNDSNNGT